MADEEDLRRVAAYPTEWGRIKIHQLFLQGYDRWLEAGETRPEALVDAIEEFGTAALGPTSKQSEELPVPDVSDPGAVAVLATLSAVCVMQHDQFEDASPSNVQPWLDIRSQYGRAMQAFVATADDPELLQDIAERMYRKSPPEHVSVPPGRTVTDIVQKSGRADGSDWYFEIPVVAAPNTVRVTEQTAAGDEELLIHIEDNNVYVPADDLRERYAEYLVEEAFPYLYRKQCKELTDDQRNWLSKQESAISDMLDRWVTGNNYELLWAGLERGERLVSVLIRAIQAVPDSIVQLDEPATPEELYTVLQEYEPEEWEASVCRQIRTPQQLAGRLKNLSDSPRLCITQTNEEPLITLTTYGDARDLSATHPTDFFQLPCYQAMEDRLSEKGPTRKELFDLVARTAWLPEYRAGGEPDREAIVEAIKETISRWDWFNPVITEYQTRRELAPERLERKFDGRVAFPMGCSNPTMQEYCIGREKCPYNLYSSIEYDPELFEALPDTDGLETEESQSALSES